MSSSLNFLTQDLHYVVLLAGHTELQFAALAGAIEAGEAVEHRGLTGAIGSDQSRYRRVGHIKADVAQRLDAAELDVQTRYF